MRLLLLVILLLVCWPAGLLVLVLLPVIWLLLLPFRLVGVAVSGIVHLLAALFQLPVRLVRAL